MTPGQAYTTIVSVFGIEGCEIRDLDDEAREQLRPLAASGFVRIDDRKVEIDLDRLTDIISAGATLLIDGRQP